MNAVKVLCVARGRNAICPTLAASMFLVPGTGLAMDRNAALGMGIGIGILGAALAAQQQDAQSRYRPAPRFARHVPVYQRPGRLRSSPNLHVETTNVATDDPYELRAYWNCRSTYGMRNVTAHALHGYIREGYSSRYVCGNLKQPAKVFTYLSSQGFIGIDEVDFFEGNRLVFRNIVNVGSFPKYDTYSTSFTVNSGVERSLIQFNGCSKADLLASADAGATLIRQTADADNKCPSGLRFTQSLIYRAMPNYSGADHVRLFSSSHKPIVFDVNVEDSGNAPEAQPSAQATDHLGDDAKFPGSATSFGEFEAAIGHKGTGRCHMDYCSYFIIDAATPVGNGRDGKLFKIEERTWGADYNPPPDNAPESYNEYAQPPKSVGKQERETRFVYCSKTRPTSFFFDSGKWTSNKLRPGDQGAIFGYNESEYTWYFAACHNAILKSPYDDHNLPRRLGYRFRNSDSGEDAQGNLAPRDMLK